jgi:hypothetical protein
MLLQLATCSVHRTRCLDLLKGGQGEGQGLGRVWRRRRAGWVEGETVGEGLDGSKVRL